MSASGQKNGNYIEYSMIAVASSQILTGDMRTDVRSVTATTLTCLLR